MTGTLRSAITGLILSGRLGQAMSVADKDKADRHELVMGMRSTVGCRCGWVANITELHPEPEEDRQVLARLHAEHVVRAAKAGAR